MRSRFSAYALGLVDYVISTTHPHSKIRKQNIASWRKELLKFSKNTSFQGLTIHEFVDSGDSATVTFTAFLKQGRADATFTERSYFERIGDSWFYKSGEFLPSMNNLTLSDRQ